MKPRRRSGIVKTYVIKMVVEGETRDERLKARSVQDASRLLTDRILSGALKDAYILNPEHEPQRPTVRRWLERRLALMYGPGAFISGVRRWQVEYIKRFNLRAYQVHGANDREANISLGRLMFGPHWKKLLSAQRAHRTGKRK